MTERQLRDLTYPLDPYAMTAEDRGWYHTKANDLIIWTAADRRRAKKLIAAYGRKPKDKKR